MNQGRDVMADIISAKCFGCGHVVKVPAALGGKKARCPQCTNTIVIPTSADSNAELVSDDQLPEVAREGEVLEGEPVEEADEVPADAEEEEATSGEGRRQTRTRTRARGGTRVRKKESRTKSGPRAKVGFAPTRRKSSAGLVVGILIAVVAVIGVAVAVVMTGDAGAPAGPGAAEGGPAEAKSDAQAAADHDLKMRCQQYTDAVNSQDPGRIMQFFRKGDNQQEVLRGVNRLVEQGTRYDSVDVKSASAASGQTTFSYSSGSGTGEKTLQWENVDGTWLLTGAP